MFVAANPDLDFQLLVDLGPRGKLEDTWHGCRMALELHNHHSSDLLKELQREYERRDQTPKPVRQSLGTDSR